MRKMLMLLAMAVGCAGDDGGKPDPHELADCDPRWLFIADRCEVACNEPQTDAADGCTFKLADGSTGQCKQLNGVDFDGAVGCCRADQGSDGFYVGFHKCE